MRINKTISMDSELFEKLNDTNASELINQLLMEHFNNDIIEDLEVLRKKTDILVSEKRIIGKKIAVFKAKIVQIQQKKDKKRLELMNEHDKKARELAVADHLKKWQNEEISDEDYYAFFD